MGRENTEKAVSCRACEREVALVTEDGYCSTACRVAHSHAIRPRDLVKDRPSDQHVPDEKDCDPWLDSPEGDLYMDP